LQGAYDQDLLSCHGGLMGRRALFYLIGDCIMSEPISINAERLFMVHQQIRAQGTSMLSICVANESISCAKSFLFNHAQSHHGQIIVVPLAHAETIFQQQSYNAIYQQFCDEQLTEAPFLLLPFPLLETLILSEELFNLHRLKLNGDAVKNPLSLVTLHTSAEVIELLFSQKLTNEQIKQVLLGLIPLGEAPQKIFDSIANNTQNDLRPLLRSAYEGLLYYLLEARPETCGRFETNQRIPNTDNAGATSFEVDLISRQDKVIIEIDGEQHNNEAQAKRDGNKARSLEKQGYRFLRFKTETVACEPDYVWTEIVKYLIQPQESISHD
jgi:very-short-patch-repair endonuclease